MIVCCPACQTQFNVDPALIGSDGRRVRCARCAHVWRVGRDGKPMRRGRLGLHAPRGATAPAGAGSETVPHAAADEAAGVTHEAGQATDKSVLPAQESGVSEEHTGPDAAASAETAGAVVGNAREREASPEPEAPGTGDAAAGGTGDEPSGIAVRQAVAQAKQKKGGGKFKTGLLLLVIVVLALVALAVATGKLNLDGIGPRGRAPSTRDVAPPASGEGWRDRSPAPAERRIAGVSAGDGRVFPGSKNQYGSSSRSM